MGGNKTKTLPEGWRWETLDKISTNIQYGISKSSASDKVGPNLLRITDIQDGKVDWDNVPFCECSSTDEERYILENDDIVFARTGATTGKSFIVNNPEYALFASYLIRVQCDRKVVDPNYLYVFFKSPTYWNYITQGARGGTLAGFNATMLSKIKIPLPPTIDDQIRIASELERKMAEVETTRQAALRQKEAAAAMQGAILREVFPYKEGDELPEGWGWEKIGNHVSDYQSGLARGDKSKKEKYPHLRMNNISNDSKLNLTLLWRIPATEDEIRHYSVQRGDILFNNTNSAALVGKSCLFNFESNETFLFSNHLTRIRTKSTLNSKYLLYWINILWQRRYFEDNCDKWVNQAAARVTDLLFPSKIPLPPALDDQIRIASELERKMTDLDKMRQAAEPQLEAIEALPGAILREVFDFEEDN